jgi:5-methylcytosine-specific restriction protein A
MPPFIFGQEYRRSQLLAYVGSAQAQSGVIWGGKEPGCVILTTGGRHGKKAGYFDEQLDDGSWWYFGQGQKGNHSELVAANKIIISGNRTILLFSAREPTAKEVLRDSTYAKFFKYIGQFNLCNWETVTPISGERANDRLIRFLLVPSLGNIYDIASLKHPDLSISALREEILLNSLGHTQKKITVVEYRTRILKVKQYALLRARGRCESCEKNAPFLDTYRRPFLEVHHILRLADDGLDAPENVAAICPNCHREAHYSFDKDEFNQFLHLKINKFESLGGSNRI